MGIQKRIRMKPKVVKNIETIQFEEIMEEYESQPKESKRIRENRNNYGNDFI